MLLLIARVLSFITFSYCADRKTPSRSLGGETELVKRRLDSNDWSEIAAPVCLVSTNAPTVLSIPAALSSLIATVSCTPLFFCQTIPGFLARGCADLAPKAVICTRKHQHLDVCGAASSCPAEAVRQARARVCERGWHCAASSQGHFALG